MRWKLNCYFWLLSLALTLFASSDLVAENLKAEPTGKSFLEIPTIDIQGVRFETDLIVRNDQGNCLRYQKTIPVLLECKEALTFLLEQYNAKNPGVKLINLEDVYRLSFVANTPTATTTAALVTLLENEHGRELIRVGHFTLLERNSSIVLELIGEKTLSTGALDFLKTAPHAGEIRKILTAIGIDIFQLPPTPTALPTIETAPVVEAHKDLKNRSKDNLFKVILLSIVLFLVVSTVIYCYYRSTLSKNRTDSFVLTSGERAEFRELRRYFTLSAKPTLPELHQSYRSLAKKLHPDVAGGAKEFTELHEKFILAQSIIKKIVTNKDENIRPT